jgi:hypothetical protein
MTFLNYDPLVNYSYQNITLNSATNEVLRFAIRGKQQRFYLAENSINKPILLVMATVVNIIEIKNDDRQRTFLFTPTSILAMVDIAAQLKALFNVK